ncbi:MAG: hypothetical protein ABIG66_03710 [Candidatus Kerfeldbacteria bacterium]
MGQIMECPDKEKDTSATAPDDTVTADDQAGEPGIPLFVTHDCQQQTDFVGSAYISQYPIVEPLPVVEIDGNRFAVYPPEVAANPDETDGRFGDYTRAWELFLVDQQTWPPDTMPALASVPWDQRATVIDLQTGERTYLNEDPESTGGKIGDVAGFIVYDFNTKIPVTMFYTNEPPADFPEWHIDGVDINDIGLQENHYYNFDAFEECQVRTNPTPDEFIGALGGVEPNIVTWGQYQ